MNKIFTKFTFTESVKISLFIPTRSNPITVRLISSSVFPSAISATGGPTRQMHCLNLPRAVSEPVPWSTQMETNSICVQAVLSLYASEGYWTGTSNQLRRYTLRIDGFVSVSSPLSGDELLTKPLIFEGDEMVLNFLPQRQGPFRLESKM